jgi:hypothetical protein
MPAVISPCERNEVLLHHLGLVHEAALLFLSPISSLPRIQASAGGTKQNKVCLLINIFLIKIIQNYLPINDIDTLTLQYALRCLTQPTTAYTGYQVAI